MKIDAAKNSPAQSVGGFPCPCCKKPIRFPFQALLTQPVITCPDCGLEMRIDMGSSAAVLENLRKYAAGLDDAEHILENPPGR